MAASIDPTPTSLPAKHFFAFHIRNNTNPSNSEHDLNNDGLVAVEFRLWKLHAPAEAAVVTPLGRRDCHVNITASGEIIEPAGMTSVNACLTALGVAPVVNQDLMRIIWYLNDYMQREFFIIRRRRHQHPGDTTVVVDIVRTTGVQVQNRLQIEEAITRATAVEDSRINHNIDRDRLWILLEFSVHVPPSAAAAVLNMMLTGRPSRPRRRRRRFGDGVGEAMRRSMEEYEARMVPASEEAIRGLEKVVRDQLAGDQVQEAEEKSVISCVICTDEDDDDELGFSRMPCKHVFHTVCIETWLRKSCSCPLCRYAMPSASSS